MISSAVLQVIAIACMIIDHIGYYLCNNFWLFRVIGRIAMPLFVFGLVQGFIHTSSKKKYFLRIAFTAIITEITLFCLSWNCGVAGTYSHNILFNYILGFLALLLLSKSPYFILVVPLIACFGQLLHLDYKWGIVALVSLFFLITKYLKHNSFVYSSSLLASSMVVSALLAMQSNWELQLFAILSFIPITFYSGKKGKRLPKYLSYAVYPGQYLLILIVRLLLFH